MFTKLEKILMPMSDVLSKNRVLIAIRDGFLIATPLLIVGSDVYKRQVYDFTVRQTLYKRKD